jgi:hypothetical protein
MDMAIYLEAADCCGPKLPRPINKTIPTIRPFNIKVTGKISLFLLLNMKSNNIKIDKRSTNNPKILSDAILPKNNK